MKIWRYNSLNKLYARVLSQMTNFTHFDKIFHRNMCNRRLNTTDYTYGTIYDLRAI